MSGFSFNEISPQRLINMLRAWFHARDRSLTLDDNCFIESSEIITPSNPLNNRFRLYTKTDGLYILDSSGTEIGPLIDGDLDTAKVSKLWESDGDAVAGETDADGDLDWVQGNDITLQGNAAPHSQTRQGLLERISHILDRGYPANPYPVTRNADDAEFNNSEQDENNTIGTHAGGDFWEWETGAGYSTPNVVSVNASDYESFLRIVKLPADTDMSALIGNITATADADVAQYEIFALCPASRFLTSGVSIGLRAIDNSTSKWARIKLEMQPDYTLDVICSYDIGGGEITDFTLTDLPPCISPFAMALVKYSTSQYLRYQFAIPGLPSARHLPINNFLDVRNFGGTGEINIDEVRIEFDNPNGDYVEFYVDSFERVE